jgi:hypothetical protein
VSASLFSPLTHSDACGTQRGWVCLASTQEFKKRKPHSAARAVKRRILYTQSGWRQKQRWKAKSNTQHTPAQAKELYTMKPYLFVPSVYIINNSNDVRWERFRNGNSSWLGMRTFDRRRFLPQVVDDMALFIDSAESIGGRACPFKGFLPSAPRQKINFQASSCTTNCASCPPVSNCGSKKSLSENALPFFSFRHCF